MSASIVEFGCGDNDGPALAESFFGHSPSEPFYLGPVLCKDHKNGFGAAVLHIQPFPNQKGRLRNPACSGTAGIADLKVDEVAADHGHDLVPLAGELSRLSDFAEASNSGVQILSRNHYAAVCVTKPLQLRKRETFNLGQMLDVYCDQHAVVGVGSACALSIQERGPGYSAAFSIPTVLHNEIDVVVFRNGHDGDPPFHSIGTHLRSLSSAGAA